jgi:hypothetical protein
MFLPRSRGGWLARRNQAPAAPSRSGEPDTLALTLNPKVAALRPDDDPSVQFPPALRWGDRVWVNGLLARYRYRHSHGGVVVAFDGEKKTRVVSARSVTYRPPDTAA